LKDLEVVDEARCFPHYDTVLAKNQSQTSKCLSPEDEWNKIDPEMLMEKQYCD
jgi:hypothetical protein